MADCSKTAVFFRVRHRMCDSIRCEKCPCDKHNNSLNVPCGILFTKYPEKAIEIVQKWSDEHSITMLEHFVSQNPKAPLTKDGTPKICPYQMGYADMNRCVHNKFGKQDCKACWNRPYEEYKHEDDYEEEYEE